MSAPAPQPPAAAARFLNLLEVAQLRTSPGMQVRVVSGEQLMLSYVELEPDAIAPKHDHVEEQFGLVLSGSITLELDGETRVLGPLDLYTVPPHAPHGGVAGTGGCVLIDVFAPPRAGLLDQLAAAGLPT